MTAPDVGIDPLPWMLIAGITLGMMAWAVIAALLVVRCYVMPQLKEAQEDRSMDRMAVDRRLCLLERDLEGLRSRLERDRLRSPKAQVSLAMVASPPELPPNAAKSSDAQLLTQGELTAKAEAALVSADAFRRFVAETGGKGVALRSDGPGLVNAGPPDPVLSADFLLVLNHGKLLAYPGFNLRRSQSFLVADQGRMAQDRLGWLFEISDGERFAAQSPAVLTDRLVVVDRGRLTIPL